MHYEIDFDPTHSVIRLTVTAETLTLDLAEEVYQRLSLFASHGGPYAAIFDFSGATRITVPTEAIRGFRTALPLSQEGEPAWLWPKSHRYTDWLVCSNYVGILWEDNIRSSTHWRKPTR